MRNLRTLFWVNVSESSGAGLPGLSKIKVIVVMHWNVAMSGNNLLSWSFDQLNVPSNILCNYLLNIVVQQAAATVSSLSLSRCLPC